VCVCVCVWVRVTGRHPCLACDLINAFRNVTSIRCVIVRLLIVNRSFHRTCFHTRLSVIETNDTWVCVYIYIPSSGAWQTNLLPGVSFHSPFPWTIGPSTNWKHIWILENTNIIVEIIYWFSGWIELPVISQVASTPLWSYVTISSAPRSGQRQNISIDMSNLLLTWHWLLNDI